MDSNYSVVQTWATAICVSSVVLSSVVAEWIARCDNFENCQTEFSHDEDIIDNERILNRLLEMGSHTSDFNVVNLINRRKHDRFPAWILFVGGLYRALAFAVIFLTFVIGISIYQCDPNYFNVAGVSPQYVLSPSFGLYLRQSFVKRQFHWPKDWGDEDKVLEILKKLFDANLRLNYDQLGEFHVKASTISEIIYTVRFTLIFYIGYFIIFLSTCSGRNCLRGAIASGFIILSVLFFLDLNVSFGNFEIRQSVFLNFVPGVATMTSFQRLQVFRNFCVPLLLIACILYSAHRFVSYEDNCTDILMQTVVDQEVIGDRIEAIIQNCQARRETGETARNILGTNKMVVESPSNRMNTRKPDETDVLRQRKSLSAEKRKK